MLDEETGEHRALKMTKKRVCECAGERMTRAGQAARDDAKHSSSEARA